MQKINILTIVFVLHVIFSCSVFSADSTATDSIQSIQNLLLKQKEQQLIDSLIKAQLEKELTKISTDSEEKRELKRKLDELNQQDSLRKQEQKAKIELLKKSTQGFPVTIKTDTLFNIYNRTGSFSAKERADAISKRLKNIAEASKYSPESLAILKTEFGHEIVYKNDLVIMTITSYDALWVEKSEQELADEFLQKIQDKILKIREDNSILNWAKKIAEILLVILGCWLVVWGINKLFARSKNYLLENKEKYFTGLNIRNSQLLSVQQHEKVALQLNNIARISVIIIVLYLSLPILFSIFPETRSITNTLLGWVLTPAKRITLKIFEFLPNFITIIVIYYFTKYTVKGFKFLFDEIAAGNITLSGFHKDWALPTFNIVKFLLYVFMMVIIFPYLPGSGSPAFQGISVFLGVLLSLGSSSAITNIIAGLVITYMRPFKIGDRVKIGDVVGDVIEKTMLVTRIRTIKNEDITVPNSAVLSSHTINYSSNSYETGLIIHTTITIGYDVPWRKMHDVLIQAALKTEHINQEPKPFVLQTSLDDFYVSYQLNAYTNEANKQAKIYSDLHQNIQDCCNENDIEILSPHYRGLRDGNQITIPSNYLPKDYQSPAFKVESKS